MGEKDDVKGEMKMMWTHWKLKSRRATAGMSVRRERRQIAKLREPYRELSYPPNIPGGQICGMCGADKEMGHRSVSSAAMGAGGVIGPAYGVAVGLEQ